MNSEAQYPQPSSELKIPRVSSQVSLPKDHSFSEARWSQEDHRPPWDVGRVMLQQVVERLVDG